MGQFLDIAATILRGQNRPMKPRQIVDAAKDEGLFSDKLSGKTPAQTMKSKLTVDVLRHGVSSRFIRTAPNTFFLRDLAASPLQTYTAARQTPSGADEHVLAFPTENLDDVGRFQGITRSWRRPLKQLLSAGIDQIDRMVAEQSEDHKQLLTYILVTRGTQLLCFRRGTFNRVEDYLRGSLCVGFGGHVSEADRTVYNWHDLKEIVYENAFRELCEELRLPEEDRKRLKEGNGLQVLGLLNDDSSSTGRKHLAVLLQYEVSSSDRWDRPTKGEKSINQLSWLDLESLDDNLRDFEYWSQLCLAEFFKRAIRTQPSFLIRRKMPFKGRHILCIIGGIGSGKSAATKILTAEFDYSEVNSGKVMAALLHIPAVPQTPRAEFQTKAWSFISSPDGPSRLASALAEAADQASGRVLIDGIRQRETIEALKQLAGPVKIALLFVYTPPHIAYQFYEERSGGRMSISTFLELHNAPVETDVKKLIADADAILYNWTGRLSYEQAVRKLMEELQK